MDADPGSLSGIFTTEQDYAEEYALLPHCFSLGLVIFNLFIPAAAQWSCVLLSLSFCPDAVRKEQRNMCKTLFVDRMFDHDV